MNFWVVFALCGFMATPCIAMAIGFGDGIKGKIKATLVCIVGWFIISGAMWGQHTYNEEIWNEGYCECGSHWELEGVTRTKFGGKTKYYVCPNCFIEIEINY